MNVSFSSWFVIALALLAANLPFLNERLFALVPLKGSDAAGGKPLWLRLIEVLVMYLLVGAVAYLLESRAGNTFAQGWEFYAITLFLFVVLAYPGFVWRYLRKRHG
ncbi:DUF2818 family protein [Undibacterium arcticum]|uniref:DUF2818 family protein n=1 Tax=Undibacterium arcticum TaxID=1762892 RepID=A0ABV7F5N5_9BURK